MNTIKPLLFQEQPIDFERVKTSWKAAFARDLSIQYWHWRFNSNPYDSQIKAAYIIDEGEVAAFYAVSPCYINLSDGQSVKAGLMNMGFTHPRFQGKGYYLKINQLLHDKLIQEGYACCFGFANHNSHYPYRKHLGWKDLSILTNFERVFVNSNPNHSVEPGDKFSIEEANSQNITGIADYSILNEKRNFVSRDKNFLLWRLVQNPIYKYFILRSRTQSHGNIFVVYKIYQNESIDLMEIFYDAQKNQSQKLLFNEIVESLDFLQNHYKTKLTLWSNLYSEEHLQLEKAGFRENTFSTYFGIQNFSKNPELDSIANWHYRFIDSDVY